MARTSQPSNPAPQSSAAGAAKKGLGVSKPPISKKPADKGRTKKIGYEILFVKTDEIGQHYGYSSMDEAARFILAPSSVSRADGDLEKDSPPASPRSSELNKFLMPKPYNARREVKFVYPGPSVLYKKLIKDGKRPVPLLYPDIDALKKLKIYDEVRDLLVHSGLSFIFREDPGTYRDATLEFISYFRSVPRTSISGEEKVDCWKFGLGEIVWQVDADVLCDWLRLPRDGEIPDVVDDEAQRFWKEISRKDYAKERNHKASSIKIPKWKIIHRFVAGCILVRSNYGRMVTKMEMMIMSMINQGRRINWLWCIAHGLYENTAISSQNKGLGGGSIVTLIAKKLGYVFEGLDAERLKLSINRMRHMYILGKGETWKSEAGSDSDNDDDLEAENVVPRIAAAPPSTDAQTILAQLRETTSLVNSLCYYVAESSKWQHDSLLAVAAHVGVTLPPPPPCPFIPRPARPVPQDDSLPAQSGSANQNEGHAA